MSADRTNFAVRNPFEDFSSSISLLIRSRANQRMLLVAGLLMCFVERKDVQAQVMKSASEVWSPIPLSDLSCSCYGQSYYSSSSRLLIISEAALAVAKKVFKPRRHTPDYSPFCCRSCAGYSVCHPFVTSR